MSSILRGDATRNNDCLSVLRLVNSTVQVIYSTMSKLARFPHSVTLSIDGNENGLSDCDNSV